MQQIEIGKTLDVEVVERQLADLWTQTAGEGEADNEAAVLRARVANLLVYVTNKAALDEVQQMLAELTAMHPSRVLLMLGQRAEADRDLEMSLTAFCQSDKRGAKRLCCEEVTLKAAGSFVTELPSAALPLLVPDLSTFLWWRSSISNSDRVYQNLLGATDRLVIDSAEFEDSKEGLIETSKLLDREVFEHVAISDLNWARLTFWRTLLADFYDVPAYRHWLDKVDHVRIDYVAPDTEQGTVAPQAWLIAGWLVSRLGWSLKPDQAFAADDKTLSFKFSRRGNGKLVEEGSDRELVLELNCVEPGVRKPGRLVQVELRTSIEQPRSFSVVRSPDNLRLVTEAKLGASIQRGRVLPVRNRSATRLLSRELEILCRDVIYQEALAVATTLINLSKSSPLEQP